MGQEKEKVFVGIEGFTNESNSSNSLHDMEVSFSVSLKSGDSVESHAIFLNELQDFLDDRACSASVLAARLCSYNPTERGD